MAGYGIKNPVLTARDIAVTGGVARSSGLLVAMKKILTANVLVPEKPEIVTATGAALIAMDEIRERAK